MTSSVRSGRVTAGSTPLGLAVAGAFVALWIFGSAFTDDLDWRYRTVPSALLMLLFGLASLVLFVATLRGFVPVRMQGTFLGRHPRFAATVLGTFGAALCWFGLVLCADVVAAPDLVVVTITSKAVSWRGSVTIVAADGLYRTPMFWNPTVEPGLARLTIGHYSREVLRIEQPPPDARAANGRVKSEGAS
jgi:hypothetical protein